MPLYTPMFPVTQPVDAVSKRSILDIMRFIVTALCGMSMILTLFGLFFINVWTQNDFNGDQDTWIFRGSMNIIISFILLVVLYYYLGSTVKKKNWWVRIQKFVDIQSGAFVGNMAMKNSLVAIFMCFYGTAIAMGIVFLGAGIFLLNVYQNFSGIIFSGVEIAIGVILIFFAYKAYHNEMETLSRDIYPMLFPSSGNADK
jgi:hypothetical protein